MTLSYCLTLALVVFGIMFMKESFRVPLCDAISEHLSNFLDSVFRQ